VPERVAGSHMACSRPRRKRGDVMQTCESCAARTVGRQYDASPGGFKAKPTGETDGSSGCVKGAKTESCCRREVLVNQAAKAIAALTRNPPPPSDNPPDIHPVA